jgi:hypothetical protein
MSSEMSDIPQLPSRRAFNKRLITAPHFVTCQRLCQSAQIAPKRALANHPVSKAALRYNLSIFTPKDAHR